MTSLNGHVPDVPMPSLESLRSEPDVDEEIAWLRQKLAQREARQREIHTFLVVAKQQLLKTELETVRLQRALDTLLEAAPAAPARTEPAAQAVPPPPLPRLLTGQGSGYQTARYLLEVLQQRDALLTLDQARLACKGWHASTIHAGLKRLITDGLAERVGPGKYVLTDAGRAAGPAETLPLLEPTDDVDEPVEAAG